MKRILFIAFAALITSFATAQNSAPVPDITKVFEFKNAEYDFGKIVFGKPVEYDVMIKNISHDSASLDNVTVGCGCTTPKYEKGKKFAPGETVKLTLGFSGNSMGTFVKQATIYFNGGVLSKQLSFRGETYTVPANPAPSNGAVEKLKTSGTN
jgi:hypothetical protein